MQTIINELLRSNITVLMLCRQMEDVPEAITHVLVVDNGEVLGCDTRVKIFANTAVQATNASAAMPTLETLPPLQHARPYALSTTESRCWSCSNVEGNVTAA